MQQIEDLLLKGLHGHPQYPLVAGAGGGRANATLVSPDAVSACITTCASAGDSVLLWPAIRGSRMLYLFNATANAAQVFASGTDTINGTAGSTGVSLGAGIGAWFIAVAPGVWTSTPTTSSSGATVLYSRLAANTSGFSGTALANTLLSLTLTGGQKYEIRGMLRAYNATAAGGYKLDFNGGTATMTGFLVGATAALGTAVQNATTLTALNTLFSVASAANGVLTLAGTADVNAGGTLIVRLAENSAVDEAIIAAGSYICATPIS